MIGQLEQAAGRSVSRETFEKIVAYSALLREEACRQNLVSSATLETLWDRHILDSAQLVRFESYAGASWIDIGSGAGLPGVVVACLVDGPVTLAEPRRLRNEFLHKVAESLSLPITILALKAERISGSFEVITARAVAPMLKLLEISHHLSTRKTVWALPKGRQARAELAAVEQAWQGDFEVATSVTDPDSFIIVGTGVRAKR